MGTHNRLGPGRQERQGQQDPDGGQPAADPQHHVHPMDERRPDQVEQRHGAERMRHGDPGGDALAHRVGGLRRQPGHVEPAPVRRVHHGAEHRHADGAADLANPVPRPTTAIQIAANPYPLSSPVVAPDSSPKTSRAKPRATTTLAPARGTRRPPTRAPTTSPPISGSSRRPVPSASAPLTAWKYCGIANSRPNSAKFITVARMVPQVKLAERNRPRSTSGCPAGRRVIQRCQSTKAPSTTTPAAMAPSEVELPQPFSPASMNP